MKRIFVVLALAGVLVWTWAGWAGAGDRSEAMESHRHGHSRDGSLCSSASSAGAQKLCPLTGQPVDKSQFVDHEGKRVYFCCAACKEPFLKDPAKYIQAMERAGVTLEPSPAR